MGSILQERVAQRCVERLCIGDREWKKKAPRSTSRPNVIKVSSSTEKRKHTHTGLRASKHTAALLDHALPHPSPDQQEELSPQEDSDTDLSESERLPVSSRPLAPRLELRPEVVEYGDTPSHCRTVRGRDFPDFLPPPFNSWNLSQLAVFYNTEGRGAFRPRPVGPLERYLERLLQLEWHQIQTVQAEHVTQDVPGGTSSCQRSSTGCSKPNGNSVPLPGRRSLGPHSGARPSGRAFTNGARPGTAQRGNVGFPSYGLTTCRRGQKVQAGEGILAAPHLGACTLGINQVNERITSFYLCVGGQWLTVVSAYLPNSKQITHPF
uniref:Protein FAM217B n=1 Tax=Poecilia mexicana TaxID=48701 RepID=A0A3B3WLS3_9TELE